MKRMATIIGISLLLATLTAWVAGAAPPEGCARCGMRLASYASTLHRLTLADGSKRTYCSIVCLAAALEEIPGATVRSIEVADYGTSAFTSAKTATYVEGSDARPVMSRVSMVAFASRADAEAYLKDHGGRIMAFAAALASERARAGLPPAPAEDAPVFTPMPRPGKKVVVDKDLWLTYDFDRKPSMGTVILRVELFDAKGKQVTSPQVLGDADMPSMKGAHTMGNKEMRRNRKGVYLLPVDIVMPGDWEIYVTIVRDGRVVFRGSHAFDI